MSALQRQSFANQFQPLFLKDSGEQDNLTLETLTINQGGNILLGSSINEGTAITFNKAVDGSSYTQLNEQYVGGGSGELELTVTNEGGYDSLGVGQVDIYGQDAALGTANYLSFKGTGTSFGVDFGTNSVRNVYLDKLETGTAILTSKTVGPAPVAMDVGAPFAVAPVPTSPSAFGTFLTSPLYPTTTGQEYDICVKGTIALASGTPDATIPDQFVVSVSVGGTGKGTQTYSFNPNYLTFYVRDRLISSSSAPSVVVGVQNTRVGTSTAVYNATLTMADVVRVK